MLVIPALQMYRPDDQNFKVILRNVRSSEAATQDPVSKRKDKETELQSASSQE